VNGETPGNPRVLVVHPLHDNKERKMQTNTPTKPVITSVGSAAAGGKANSALPVITGTADANNSILVYDGIRLLGTVMSDASGNWSLTPTTVLKAGAHSITVLTLDSQGDGSPSSEPFSTTVQAAPVSAVHSVSNAPSIADHADQATPIPAVAADHTVVVSATPDVVAAPALVHAETVTQTETAKVGATVAIHLAGDQPILDLTSLSAKTTANVSDRAATGLADHSNNAKLSLTDVLNLGEHDLFQKDGKHQVILNDSNGDSNGDTVDVSNAHIAGVTDGQWQQHGTAHTDGVTYDVHVHSGAQAELLVQQGLQVALHS